jgi:hypothetical protein
MLAPVRRGGDGAALLAAGLAFASAAVSAYWTLGGDVLLDTVGGTFEDLARERSPGALALGAAVVAAKALAGLLALALVRRRGARLPRPALRRAATAGGALLALYGGVLTLVGALALAGPLRPSGPVDEHALRWHVLLWDPWFLVWGVALLVAGRRAAARARRP